MTLPLSMAAIAIAGPGGPEVLRVVELPVPRPAPGEVVIRVAAAGVNGPDLLQRRGQYDPPPGHSPLPGLEVSGEIAATGSSATRYQHGDKVVALCNGGGYAEYVAVPEGQVLPLPQGWTFAEGATLPETFVTIQQTLVDRAGLMAGMNVLIHGGAGGLGATAIQVSRLTGTKVIATVSSPEKAAYALELGADHLVAYTREDFVARTLEVTGGHGADRIIDVVGGAYLDRNIAAAARGGTIIFLARLGGSRAELDIAPVMTKGLTLFGSVLRPQSLSLKAAICAHLERDIWPALADGRIKPQRIRTFPLAEAPLAHAAMEASNHLGKIVLLTGLGAG